MYAWTERTPFVRSESICSECVSLECTFCVANNIVLAIDKRARSWRPPRRQRPRTYARINTIAHSTNSRCGHKFASNPGQRVFVCVQSGHGRPAGKLIRCPRCVIIITIVAHTHAYSECAATKCAHMFARVRVVPIECECEQIVMPLWRWWVLNSQNAQTQV